MYSYFNKKKKSRDTQLCYTIKKHGEDHDSREMKNEVKRCEPPQ